jgi:WhiB family redox-sensing transcriptional regulator
MILPYQGSWTTGAKCLGTRDALFVEGAAQRQARVICTSCPVRRECAAEALNNHIEFGIWGGLTERERRHLLRNRPDVTCWQSALQEDSSLLTG